MRNVIFKLHLYAALGFGAFILILGLSGAAMVFTEEVDRSLNPNLFSVPVSGNALPVSEVRKMLPSQIPGVKVGQLRLPQGPGDTYLVQFQGKSHFLNPYTGQLVGTREGQTWISTLSKLHTGLLMGEVGATIVHLSSIVLLFLVFSGVYLWFPYKRWRIALSASFRRAAFDTHLSLGIFTFLLIGIFAATGIVLSFEHTVRETLVAFEKTKGPNRNVPSQPMPGASPLLEDEAIVAAAKALPGATPLFVQLPVKATASYVVGMRFPEDRTPIGRSWVTVDQYSGRALAQMSSRTAPRPARALIVARALHTGDMFGLPSRIVMLLASLVVAMQTITGSYLWWKKFRPAPRGNPAPAEAKT